jgi:hypothetical protein
MIVSAPQSIQIDAVEYHQRPEISCSMLKVFIDSPKMYFKRFVEKTIAPKSSPAMVIGSLAHAAILEPHVLEGHCIRIPAEVLNDQGHKKGKAWLDFKAENEGKTLLDDYDYNRIRSMFDSVYANEFATRFLRASGEAEKTILWNVNGQPVRSRLDRLLANHVVDVKTCREGDASEFARGSYTNLAYWVQAAFYLDAAKALDGIERQFVFVCAESEEPYRSFVCVPEDRDIALGRDTYKTALEMIAECHRTGDWREPSELIVNRIALPEWKHKTSV